MIFLGAALMVCNIIGFIRFARSIIERKTFETRYGIIYIPIVLLILFLLGYLAVGLFGSPDVIMAGILFGGSIFVFIMYQLLTAITNRVFASEQMRTKLLAEEEANRARTEFLASMSHEMRTPMNVILGLDSVALRNPDLPPETREQLEKIGQSGQRLLGLINNILNMNSLGKGTLELRDEPFSLAEALEQVNAVARPLCEEKGLTYQTVLREGALGRKMGDDVQLRQVLISILDNAVKYSDAPGTIIFTTEAVRENGQIRTLIFTISDTGVGIDAAFPPKVFDVFLQEDSSSTSRFGGSGISMAVAKSIMELMGGSIAVESEKNVGTTFTVTAPLRVIQEETAHDVLQEEVSLEGKHILIVEDLPENAEIVMDLLELEGVTTEHAENGQIAVDMFARSQPGTFDAVLMDLRMPVMDGLEATRCIRALDHPDARAVPIIALTANAFESDIRASLEAGMNAHLAKPTDADYLYTTLKRLIAGVQAPERSKAR